MLFPARLLAIYGVKNVTILRQKEQKNPAKDKASVIARGQLIAIYDAMPRIRLSGIIVVVIAEPFKPIASAMRTASYNFEYS